MEKIDFTKITACGECCVGCKKKKLVCVKAASKPMVIVKSGQNRDSVQYTNVQKNTESNFVGYALNFHAKSCQKKFIGILTSFNT